MQASVTLFVLDASDAGRAAPEPSSPFDVEAASEDLLRARVVDMLLERGLRVRAISFGPRGITAYAERAS